MVEWKGQEGVCGKGKKGAERDRPVSPSPGDYRNKGNKKGG